MFSAIPYRALYLIIGLTTLFYSSILFFQTADPRLLVGLDALPPAHVQVPISYAADRILPVPSRTYIVHLARRLDRHREMERLRTRLGVEWAYVHSTDSDSPQIDRIMSTVRGLRRDALAESGYAGDDHNTTVSLPFEWPDERTPISFAPFEDSKPSAPGDIELLPQSFDDDEIPPEELEPLTCATEDFSLTPYSPKLSEVRILTHTRVACWHSHLSAIRHAATQAPAHASLFFEDDIDMEVDIRERLASVWTYLPPDWDIVFLGHCWSNETRQPPLGPPSPLAPTHIHPSTAPLCAHAYALSPTGAARVLRHLTHAPFAYSRPVDNALAWLIKSGRIRSFSVVPSVVVQRKKDASDVLKGVVYKLRYPWDRLDRGVLAEADEEEERG